MLNGRTLLTLSRAPLGESCGGCGGLVQGSEQRLSEEVETGDEITFGIAAWRRDDGVVVVVALWLHSRSVTWQHPRRREKPTGL